MAEQNKYLQLARAAREENNTEDAKKYYEMLYMDQPENPEAKWYNAYYSLMDCRNMEIPEKFKNVCSVLVPTLKLVAKIEDEDEKQTLCLEIVNGFLPLTETLRTIILKNNALPADYSISVRKNGNATLRGLGDEILDLFGETEPYITLVVDMWKELIDERHALPYRNYQDKNKELWFDKMAKKIQKYDPSYVMPQFKQNGGCVSGNAALVQPGE